MAAAEARHRARIEERLRELGAPIPDESAVELPTWLRLQASLAPLHRVLARMEAAEQDERIRPAAAGGDGLSRSGQARPHPGPRALAPHRSGLDLGRDLRCK